MDLNEGTGEALVNKLGIGIDDLVDAPAQHRPVWVVVGVQWLAGGTRQGHLMVAAVGKGHRQFRGAGRGVGNWFWKLQTDRWKFAN